MPTKLHIRVKLDCLLDCVRRALDGLAVDEHHQPNWSYVAGQLNAACQFANHAEEMALCALTSDDAAADFHPEEVIGLVADPFLPSSPGDGAKGGAA